MALSRVVRGLPEGLLIDTIAHELGAVLGPHSRVMVVPSDCSTFALDIAPDALPEHVAPDASAASRMISIAIALSGGAR